MFDTLPIQLAEPATQQPAAAGPAADAAGSDRIPALDPEVAARHAREWAECSGAILAKLVADAMSSLADIPDDLAGDQQIFDLVTANARVAAWATANQARLTALVYQRARREHEAFGLVQRDGADSAAGPSHGYDDERFTSSEIAANLAMELGLAMPVAEREVAFGLGLARDEDVRLALAVGRLDVAQARAVVDELTHVPDPAVREPVVAALVTDPESPGAADVLVKELRPGRKRLWDLPPAELRSIIRREVGRRAPEVAEIRLAVARAGRHVRFIPQRDAMAQLVVHGPAEVLAAAYDHLNLTAHATKRQHDGQPEIATATLDELRHDIAIGWLTHGERGLTITYADDSADHIKPALPRPRRGGTVLRRRPTTSINVTVADTTLLGLDDLPAVLHTPAGPMPLPADLARQLAYDPEQATWRRVLCDPRTGAATDVSRSYRPPPRIAEFVKIRDGMRSRFPGSNATHLELDHIVPFRPDDPETGGPTTAANLSSDGLRDHHLKTDGAITVVGDANGPLTYRGRSGNDHLSWPFQYLDPAPEPATDPVRAQDSDQASGGTSDGDGVADVDMGDPPF